SVALQFQRFPDRPACLHHILIVGKRDPFDVNRRLQCRNKFRHVHGKAFVHRPASPWRSCTLLAYQRRWSHLPARHAIDGVIHEEHGYLLTAISRMNDFRGSNGREITVALIRNYDLVRTGSLDASGGRGSSSVRHLNVAHIEVVVGEYRATDWAHEYGFVLQAEILERLCDQLVGDPVAASRAIMRLVLQVGFALVM